MSTLCKVFLALALSLATYDVALAHSNEPPARRLSVAEKAFESAKIKAWDQAYKQARQSNEPIAVKLIEWLHYQSSDLQLRFATVADFIENNPNWPRLSRLRRNAETLITPADDDVKIAAWLKRYPPLSGAGALAHLDSLTALGRLAEVRALAPQYWRELNFKRDQDRTFVRKYARQLANADHLTRLDRLIWDQKYWPAQRMLPRVANPEAALGRARLALMRREGGVDAAIARVPQNLRDAEGLVYERLRWRRRKGKDQSARELLLTAPPMGANADRWATERRILARRAIADGHYSEALRMVAPHGLDQGSNFAEAEFLAGWISLEFLNEAETAYQHFTRLYDGVGYPISRARGAFWAGRAADAAGNSADAESWYVKAAAFPATYYGQRAAEALGRANLPITFTAPPADPQIASSFEPELTRAVRFLHKQHQTKLLKPFLRHLVQLSQAPQDRFAVVALANDVEQPQEALRAAKRIAQIDQLVPAPGYPQLASQPNNRQTAQQSRQAALILSLIRQESAFDPRAVSRAGARGMMQLMPATAKITARSVGVKYSRSRLLNDPDYNVRLGTAYLDQMLDRFDHAPALALAAYNAGPHRVDRWVRQYGDPRTGQIDLIDWIESIPFSETRNYVQRVLESEIVYQQLLFNEQVAVNPTPLAITGAEGNQP